MGTHVKDLTNAMAATLADALEREDTAWTKPYHASGPSAPHNPVTARPYTGINWLFLAAAGNAFAFDYGGWATYRQWQKADCQVRKGERSVRVIRVASSKCCDNKACREGALCGETPRKWVVPYSVFNATQVDGEVPVAPGYERPPRSWSASEVTEMFRMTGSEWKFQPDIVPHYDRSTDVITTPPPDAFDDAAGWASTVAHEHAHWTGHSTRTGRHKRALTGPEGRPREEMVAELAAVVICSALGIEHSPVSHHAKYLKYWARHLRGADGGSALVAAAAESSRAAGLVVDAITVGIQEREAVSAAARAAVVDDRAGSRPLGIAARALPTAPPVDPTLPARTAVAGWLVSRATAAGGVAHPVAAQQFGALLSVSPLSVSPPELVADAPEPAVEVRVAVRDWLVDAKAVEMGSQDRVPVSSIHRILGLTDIDVDQARARARAAASIAPPEPVREPEPVAVAAEERTRGRGGYGGLGL